VQQQKHRAGMGGRRDGKGRRLSFGIGSDASPGCTTRCRNAGAGRRVLADACRRADQALSRLLKNAHPERFDSPRPCDSPLRGPLARFAPAPAGAIKSRVRCMPGLAHDDNPLAG
jgi:hypothetical protein